MNGSLHGGGRPVMRTKTYVVYAEAGSAKPLIRKFRKGRNIDLLSDRPIL